MKIKVLVSTVIALGIVGSGIYYFASKPKAEAQQSVSVTQSTNDAVVTPSQPVEQVAVQTQEVAQTAPVEQTKVSHTNDVETSTWLNEQIHVIEPQAKNLNPNVLKLSLTAYQKAEQRGVIHNNLLTIIDYSKASNRRRLWVVDLVKEKVLFNTWVAHGKNSGNVHSTSFSNRPGSLESSLGVFVTSDIYSGKHGKSLHVQGLEAGFNNNAYDRAIVIHGANYVSGSIAKSTGRVGRSWGCMAVSENVINPLINTLKSKSLIFAYYPDKKWLSHSSYLT